MHFCPKRDHNGRITFKYLFCNKWYSLHTSGIELYSYQESHEKYFKDCPGLRNKNQGGSLAGKQDQIYAGGIYIRIHQLKSLRLLSWEAILLVMVSQDP